MPMFENQAYRTDPGSGQAIRTKRILEPFDGMTIHSELVCISGSPVRWFKVGADEVQSGRQYPYVGSDLTVSAVFAAAAATGSTTVRLANFAMDAVGFTATTALSPVGLAVVILDGAAMGDIRIITAWNAGAPTAFDKTVVLNRGIRGNVTTSDHYHLGLYCLHDTEMLIKTEFSSSDTAVYAEIVASFYDLGYDYDFNPRAPSPSYDRVIQIPNLGIMRGSVNSAKYHGQITSVPCKGGTVAAVHVKTPPSAGNLSLWIGAI